MTNRHVIEGATDILVTLQDNTLLRATLLAQADQIDVALIKVTPDSPLPTVGFWRWRDAVRRGRSGARDRQSSGPWRISDARHCQCAQSRHPRHTIR